MVSGVEVFKLSVGGRIRRRFDLWTLLSVWASFNNCSVSGSFGVMDSRLVEMGEHLA